MRLAAAAVLSVALAASTTACVPSDVQDPNQRTLIGAVSGATFGAGLGATVAINPPVGAAIGAGIGGVAGAMIGYGTAEPAPTYEPIEPPSAAVIPGFYDTWAPGYHPPPLGSEAPRPPARPG